MAVCHVCVKTLRVKRQQWIDCLDGADNNSICSQLTQLTWNITASRVLMEEAIDRAPDAEAGGKQVNRLLVDLLKESFLTNMLLGLRRLMDKEGLEGERGVYSLRSLLSDVSKHAHLLTREACIQLGPPGQSHGHLWLQDWPSIKNRLFDQLTGTAERERSSDDQISRNLFDERRAILEEKYERIKEMINKEIAHAATPTSRRECHYQGILWGDLYDLHGELCKTAHFLQDIISETGMASFLPVFQGDEFKYLSRPMVAEQDLHRLADRWAELEAEYTSWSHWRPR